MSLLRSTPLHDKWVRQRLVRLIGRLDTAGQHQSLLRSVLLDPRETYDVRDAVMRLAHWRPPWLKLSREEFSRLAGRTPSYEGDDLLSRQPGPTFTLSSVLCEAGLDEDSEELARDVLSAATPDTRARILHDQRPGALTPSLMEWLFLKWWEEDRHHLDKQGDRGHELNGFVALECRNRPGMWDLLTQWARNWPTDHLKWHVLPRLSPAEQVRLLTSHPELHQRAVAEFLLPLRELHAALGTEGLSRALRKVVLAESLALVVNRANIVERPEPFGRAVKVLGEWGAARPLLYELLCSFDVDVEARGALLMELFARDRAAALRWTFAAVSYPDNLPLVMRAHQLAARHPRPEDRPLFLRWLRDEDVHGQLLAMEGLMGLGESGAGWRDRLTFLARSDSPRVRLNAAAGLVREGLHEWLEPLRLVAVDESPGATLRSEAIRWLGVLDAEASRSLLYRALETPPGPGDIGGFGAPPASDEANEAAWALNRLGTPEDLARLLDARVRGQCGWYFDDELENHVLRQEGRSRPPPPSYWERGDLLEFAQAARDREE
ncbi:HEAT repeat domain-containing protein [Myxococcus sp. CA040A]|uniref:HEAT repeat domain-containing protein n=1 Tax=Myxococcus sp. CA040A TaxID=2741738 RepID=UPI00157B54F9|nr:HEAT repeat domain-containing protein [Myxococcus sp. CA040A]NTX07745.1 HEAT repeat domain-containing protein [Myxococcus sp. CA040A]